MSDSTPSGRRTPLGRGSFREIRLERRSKLRATESVPADAPAVPPGDLGHRLESCATLLAAARPHLEWAAGILAGLPGVVYLVDRDGIVVWSGGPTPEIIKESGAVPGVDWSERAAGTNAAGSALVADQPVLAAGSPEGAPAWRRYSAMAVPLHAPDGSPAGAVVAASSVKTRGEDRLALAAYAAFAAERQWNEEEGRAGPPKARPAEARVRRDEAGRFRRLLDAAPDATVLVDESGSILYANRQVEQLLGYPPDELVGKPVEILVPESLRGTHVIRRDSFFRNARVREMGVDLDLHARRRDGREVPVEISLSPIRMREGYLVSASLRDVTARKEALRRLEIQYSVSRELAEAGSVSEVMPRILQAIVRATGWDAGELWLVDPDAKALRASEFWCLPSLDFSEFERETRALLLERGRSMAGRVWEDAAPVLMPDLSREGSFARSQAALRTGLRSGFGFPITLADQVIGVFGFFSRADIALDGETRRMLAALGNQVGQFIGRRRAEEGRRASEAKLELLLGQMPLGLWAVDENLTVTYCAGKLYGTGGIRQARAYLGKSQRDFFPADHPALRVHEDALRGTSGHYDLESQGRFFKCHVVPLRDSKGRIVGALSAAIDVTDLERSREQLKESEARLRLVTGQMPAALWTTDRDLRLVSVTGGVLKNLGLEASGLAGLTVAEACRKLEIDETPVQAHARGLAGETVEFESCLRGRILRARVEPLRDGGNRTVGVIGCAFDVTEVKRAQAESQRVAAELDRRVAERTGELEEALREMNAFSYSIAHDLRAPLRAIASGAAIVLEESDRLGDEGRAWAGRILKAAHRMDALVTGLLEYSRLLRAAVTIAPVGWEEVVDETLEHMENEIFEREGVVEVERPLPRVRGHGLTLEEALGNLLSNALKFVASGVRPRVRVRGEVGRDPASPGGPEPGWVRLWVEDNGIGIDPEHHERIFGLFERLNRAESYAGTGMGLAIVRRVIERMGGKVGVASALGQGSRFWIDLPAV